MTLRECLFFNAKNLPINKGTTITERIKTQRNGGEQDLHKLNKAGKMIEKCKCIKE